MPERGLPDSLAPRFSDGYPGLGPERSCLCRDIRGLTYAERSRASASVFAPCFPHASLSLESEAGKQKSGLEGPF